jgi:hypothetical protein
VGKFGDIIKNYTNGAGKSGKRGDVIKNGNNGASKSIKIGDIFKKAKLEQGKPKNR